MIKQNKRTVGTRYEQIAADYLEKQGYVILEKNYRCYSGEIDLIAKDKEYLVFCEVKYRSDLSTGHPLEAVDLKKQHTIIRCAEFYLMEHELDEVSIRFDVIGILQDDIILLKNAFECV